MHRTNLLLISAAAMVLTFACDAQFPTSLEIANPNPVGSGARALGQGNAFIAVADDATAASWNPGGLPQLQRPEFSLAFEAIDQRERTRLRAREIDSFDFQSLNYGSLVLPRFYQGRNYVISLNYLNLYRFERDLDLPFDVRTVLSNGLPLRIFGAYKFEQEGSFSVAAPAFAVNVTPRLLMGVTLNLWHHSLTDNSRFETQEFTSAFRDLAGNVAAFDPSVTVNKFEVESGQSVVLGSLYRLNKQWAFGGVIKPGFRLNLDHEQSVTVFPAGGPPVTTLSSDSSPDLQFPWILGLGVAWRPSDALTMSSDVTFSDWSEYRFKKNVSRNPLDGSHASLTDVFTVRWGSEYLLIFDKLVVPFRCGLGYDPAPTLRGHVDEFYAVSVGTGIQLFNRVNFDAAYEYRWGNRVNGAALQGFNTTQDVERHRILASVIWYF